MIIKGNFAERRKHHRFKLKAGLLAGFKKPFAFKLGHRTVNVSPVVDLSAGGLSFHYVSRDMWTPKFNKMSVTKPLEKIKIDNLSFKPVSDFSISKLDQSTFLRRCGVKFERLTPIQKNLLHYFIQKDKEDNYPVDRRRAKDRRQSGRAGLADSEKRRQTERRKRRITI